MQSYITSSYMIAVKVILFPLSAFVNPFGLLVNQANPFSLVFQVSATYFGLLLLAPVPL